MKNNTLASTVDTIASECLAVRMRLLNRTVTSIFDKALRPLGLKVSQLNVLVVVAQRGPVSPTDVGRVLHLEKSTLSRNVERIQRRGWVEVTAGKDNRSHLLQLTAKGERLLQNARSVWEQAQAKARAALGRTSAEALERAASRIWAADRVG